MDNSLSVLIHADSKVGKTTLSATAPGPILGLDAEGGWKFLPIRKVTWDPQASAPPVYDGTWDVCIVMVQDWSTLQYVYQWLKTGQHPFRSVIVDSITEIQRRCKQNMVGTEAMKMQDWGLLLTRMDDVIRGIRDLALPAWSPIQVVVFIAETRETNGKWKPYMQGQISTALPYWMDIVGYLFVTPILDANGQATDQLMRRLLITPNAQFEAGERVQGRLPGTIDHPNITSMLIAVYPELTQQTQPATEVAAT